MGRWSWCSTVACGDPIATWSRLLYNTLPLPTTFVIDQRGIIRSADVRVDYRNRAEPAQTIEILKQLRTET